jgi:hypothetical protein
MSIVLVGSTSGSITLQEPAVAGTTVLDLPATSGTLITTGTTGQVIASGALPIGSVLQVVQGSLTGSISTASGSLIATGLTASITPKFSTSKILVTVNLNCCGKTTNTQLTTKVLRGASTIYDMGDMGGYTNTTLAISFGSIDAVYLDSPATTSSTTYSVSYANLLATGAVYINWYYNTNSTTSTITLMEIAA